MGIRDAKPPVELSGPVAKALREAVADADGQRAADLVAVAGPYATHGRSDRLATRAKRVEEPVFFDMPREDDMSPVADHQIAGDVDPPLLQAVDALPQGGHGGARADHDGLACAKLCVFAISPKTYPLWRAPIWAWVKPMP